ncbi:LysE/ArgO family amino acid transporter [Evansella tamaricis]|uniref:LysE/ArgO family amino acid transporter n=1 Tax=Evansella tamaricis TaxID=2069301 RepID=A0ABS6JMD7_9BACI|nr:LysE/ArgO family amino acid transporter [Evansella tamaricis]MBU9713585.1 LysE/ArgO family amino acid transporter [Evansella tamaricis]
MLEPIIHGFILALGLILPPGVQNIFLFNQGIIQPKIRKALPAYITASLCDTILILLAVLGTSLVIHGSLWIKEFLIWGGVVFLTYMGWSTWKSEPSSGGDITNKRFTIKKQILFAASVSLLNPHAIIDTVGVIGPSSVSYNGEEKLMFAISCIIVSWAFFLFLILLGHTSRKIDKTGGYMLVLNKISALFMWGAAIYLGLSIFI